MKDFWKGIGAAAIVNFFLIAILSLCKIDISNWSFWGGFLIGALDMGIFTLFEE